MAELLSLEEGAGPSNVATKFFAGEERMETGGNLAYVALAAAAPGATSVKVSFASIEIILKKVNVVFLAGAQLGD